MSVRTGVTWEGYTRATRPWRACIYQNKKCKSLGYFYTQEEAAREYDAVAKQLFGESAVLNYHPDGTINLNAKTTLQGTSSTPSPGPSPSSGGGHSHGKQRQQRDYPVDDDDDHRHHRCGATMACAAAARYSSSFKGEALKTRRVDRNTHRALNRSWMLGR